MDLNRAKIIDDQFRRAIKKGNYPEAKSQTSPEDLGLSRIELVELFDSQMLSRHLDLIARTLKEDLKSYYTIGSSGHEGNAAIAGVFDTKDMAFLHYRSGAFMAQRAKKALHADYIYEQILSLVASSADPISGGRHKVLGSLPLNVPPQTSTIASHLPKALGAAYSIILANNLPKAENFTHLESDSVILCSFGDGSFNHSTAQGAFNATEWIFQYTQQLPIIWICEDNGWGISVPTPSEWIVTQMRSKKAIHYVSCDGLNLADVYRAAKEAEYLARKRRLPVFLHMKTIRLMGHAGSDIEFHYKAEKDIIRTEQDDPLLHTARIIKQREWLTDKELLQRYEDIYQDVLKQSKRALAQPKLQSISEICASIIPPIQAVEINTVSLQNREKCFGKNMRLLSEPRNMAQHINFALTDLMLSHDNIVVFGEDVGNKGGVYRVTQDLKQRFGRKRVFDTILDEQTILGTALGLAQNGFVPIPEIQFLAYVHNAVDQIRGEAATLSFFSNGQFTNPMVIRIPGLAYQKGFGGHFHNDNAFGFLREIPGVIIVCPSQPRDAALLLREAVRLAAEEQRVVIFLEPIALYMTKDLYKAKDNKALQVYPDVNQKIHFGEVGLEGDAAADYIIVSYANGMHLSRQAAKILDVEHNCSIALLDLRWLSPLPVNELLVLLENRKGVLIVDESRRTGSLSEEIVTCMVENMVKLPQIKRITAEDCFIPLGEAFEAILPKRDNIVNKILEFFKDKDHARPVSIGRKVQNRREANS
tara:strand:- start:74564 stop:76843 length:2280 start_codon:yes stop_codon:yes gene_type:complete